MTEVDIHSLCDEYELNSDSVEFYFDRDPDCFCCIKQAFLGCSIHVPLAICPVRMKEEMAYWSIDEGYLDHSCLLRLETQLETLHDFEKNMTEKLTQYYLQQQTSNFKFNMKSWSDLQKNLLKFKTLIWSLVEDPSSSIFAKLWMVVSILFIIISLTTFVIGTLPGYYTVDEDGFEVENEQLEIIETVCMSWFTFEYVVRFIVAPKKFLFLRQFLNIIDLLTIIPFFVQLFPFHYASSNSINNWKHITQVMRIMRVIRVFRLGRHSGGLKLLFVTLRKSFNELLMLSFYLLIGVVLLAGVIFAVEDKVDFPNLGEAMWFATVTITTVGFGDYVPATLFGKIVTSMSFLMGILAIAMPIHPIISNFSNCYRNQRDAEAAFKRTLRLKDLRKETREFSNDLQTKQRKARVLATTKNLSNYADFMKHASNFSKVQSRRKTISGLHAGSKKFSKRRWSSYSARNSSSVCSKEGSAYEAAKESSQRNAECNCIFCSDI